MYLKSQYAFLIIKPEALELEEKITTYLRNNDFELVKKDRRRLSKKELSKIYEEHLTTDWIDSYIDHIASDDSILMILKYKWSGEAQKILRELTGNTNPLKAEEKTLRWFIKEDLFKKLGSIRKGRIIFNAVHVPENRDGAQKELTTFFDEKELILYLEN